MKLYRLIHVICLGVAMTTAGLVMASATVREDINTRKLTQPNKVIRPLEEGDEFVRVTVNLVQPWQMIGQTDWRSEKARAALRKDIRGRQQQVLDTLSQDELMLRHRFKNMTSFSGEVTWAGLKKLSNDRRVESIEPVLELQAHGAQGISLMNAMTTRSEHNGQGVAIAICDTGVDYTHPMLGGGGSAPTFNTKVIGGYDFGDNDNDPIPDGEPHGTACAGIAAGDLTTVGDYIGGVAYGAKLYALKITSGSSGSASSDDMAAAWDWCVSHQNDDPANPIMVISTSFGGGRHFSACDGTVSSMTTAANNAVAAGITLLVSSGNDGYCDAISWPACISSAISVGAVYDSSFGTFSPCISSDSCAPKTFTTGCSTLYHASDSTAADKVTSYSNTASFLDILAPSNQAYTTDISGGGGYSSGDYTSSFGGTSAACPYAAGIVAALQSASKNVTGSFLTPDEIRTALTAAGDDVTDDKVAVTKPRVNLGSAMEFLNLTQTPPTAHDVTVSAPSDETSVSITLDAIDDGTPQAISYIITSLPTHGYLLDPAGQTMITTVPHPLSGNMVDYMLRPNCDLGTTFTYIANDGGTTPNGGDSNEAIVSIMINPLQTLYTAYMDTDPNWSYDGDWDWGQPTGQGGSRGGPDPTSGYSGSNVIGYNLNGDYPKFLSPTQWAATPAIDCSDCTGTTLEFYRWLNVDASDKDQAFIEVSSDGTTWTTIWQNSGKVTDSGWTPQTFDISAIADDQSTVYIRWGMGPTNNNQNYSGWNIDDVTVNGTVLPAPPVAGDFEPDCDVDANDLLYLISFWLSSCGDCDGADLAGGDGHIHLDWDDNSEDDVDSYTVYRSTTSGSGYIEIASGLSDSAYADSNFIDGTTYYYTVTATDTSGNESANSAEASVSAVPLILTAASVIPGSLAYDFDGGTPQVVSSNTFTGVTADNWVMGSSSDYGTVSDGIGTDVKARTNVQNNNWGQYMSFTVNIGNTETNLTGLDFEYGLNEDYHPNAITPQWRLQVSVDGGSNIQMGSGQLPAGTVNGLGYFLNNPNPTHVDLTGLTGLSNTTVTFTWEFSTYEGRTNTYRKHVLDDVTLTGTTGDITAPAAPTGLTATTGDGLVNLSDFQVLADNWLEG